MNRSFRSILTLLLCLVAAPTSALAQEEPPPEPVAPETQEIGLLFAQTAQRGKLEHPKGEDSSRFNLVLRGVGRQVVWFQDRPGRQSGEMPILGFAREWEGFGFEDDPPNAALSLLEAPSQSDMVILTLGTPRLEANKEKLVYPVRIEDEATGNLAHLDLSRDEAVPTRFRDASLFIDDGSAPVINGCVIQSYSKCPGANLAGADLAGANLAGADLAGANLSGAYLDSAYLPAANLAGADLEDASLHQAGLWQADLTGANLTGANLNYATLARAEGANLTNVNLTDANLSFANLNYINLTDANLLRANFLGAALVYANLTNANLTGGVDFPDDVRYIGGARFCNTTMPDGSIKTKNCPSAPQG